MSEEKKNLKENGLTDEQIGQVSGGSTDGNDRYQHYGNAFDDAKEAAESQLEERLHPTVKKSRLVHR